jgi:hypothetical protein
MNKNISMLICAGLLSVTGIVPAQAATLTFVQVVDGVDPRKNTQLATKENWVKAKGQEVTWSGVVHDVDRKGSNARLFVADSARSLYKGYNIVVYTPDVAEASNLAKGQTVRFKAIINDFDAKNPGTVVELKEAQILK